MRIRMRNNWSQIREVTEYGSMSYKWSSRGALDGELILYHTDDWEELVEKTWQRAHVEVKDFVHVYIEGPRDKFGVYGSKISLRAGLRATLIGPGILQFEELR